MVISRKLLEKALPARFDVTDSVYANVQSAHELLAVGHFAQREFCIVFE